MHVTEKQIDAIAKGFAPIIKQFVDQEVTKAITPLIYKLAELEGRLAKLEG